MLSQITSIYPICRCRCILFINNAIVYIQVRYDSRVRVVPHKKAWCDEPVMLGWIRQQWNSACDGEMFLILDIHKAQKMDNVKAQFSSRSSYHSFLLAAQASFNPWTSQ